mgnify:CR=1 FL=1
MAIIFDSLATTKSTILGFFRGKLSDWDLSPKGFFGKAAAVATLVHYQMLRTARQIDLDAVPTSKTSTAGLDEWAENGTGVPNGAGGYGRKGASPATGGVGPFTGVGGTVIPDGLSLTASDGVTKFEVVDGPYTVSGTAPATGSVSANINATTAGAAGNLDAGAVLSIDSPPMGADSSVTLSTGLSGGVDKESNDPLLVRVQGRIRNPPKALTGPDLREIAEGITGCARAYVYGVRNGTGTWDVVPVSAGSGTGRNPGDPTVATTVAGKVKAALVATRNITVEGARTLQPTFAGSGRRILARCTPSASKYSFDWDSTGGTWSVDTIVDTTHIKLNTLASASLKAAIDAGNSPRIQIRTTGVVLPVEHRCTGWSDGGGKTTLTLETALVAATTPSVSDPVHAGGPIVETVAQALLDYVNSLGPSKVSGYADTSDDWDDTIRIDQLRRAVLDAVDSDEARMVIAMPAAPTVDGSATDVQAADNTTNPPELLYARSITVAP